MENSDSEKKVYPLMMRHMDLIWRRRFYGYFTAPDGELVRPYSEIEDRIFDQMIDFSDRFGYPGSSECAAQLRHYLDRNPDQKEKVKKVVKDGSFALEGGGETLIDANMVTGESIYRNLYYGLSYFRDEFGVSPITAQNCDIFGLSAQLPQIYRQFGLYNINNYSRVFRDHKPFWKGLDGSLICIHRVEDTAEFCGVGHGGVPCGECHGEGCEYCDYTGFDYSNCKKENNYPQQEERLDEFFSRNHDVNPLFMIENGEESLYPDDFPELYEKVTAKYGFRPVYASYDRYFTDIFGDHYKMLKNGSVPDDLIDERTEGNPVFCGCYTSRIRIKQMNRKLEDMLLSAETLSTLAFDKKDYPYLKLRDLWRSMAILQFHDCITGSHSDGGYDELTALCRELLNGTAKLINIALAQLTDGGDGFTLFNLTGADAENAPLHAIFDVIDGTEAVDIFDADGEKLPVCEVRRVNRGFGAKIDVTFLGNVKAYSAAHFTWKSVEKAGSRGLGTGEDARIENEFYIVSRDGIYDKALGKRITRPGLLKLTDERGDPWSKFDPETIFVYLTGSEVTAVQKSDNMSVITFRGSYTNEKMGVNELVYTVNAALYKGVRGVYYKAMISWNGENCHIYADFPLNFRTGGKAFYEIPFGTLERGPVAIQYDANSIADSYPAIGFAACRNEKENYTVALLNQGIPGYRVEDDGMMLSLLRSPTEDKHGGMWFDGARDNGKHEFSYMITSFEGTGDSDGDPVRMARLYNHVMPCVKGKVKAENGKPLIGQRGNAVVTSLRRTMDGMKQLRAYAPYGENASLTLDGRYAETDPLAERVPDGAETTNNFNFRAYEIKTITEKEV